MNPDPNPPRILIVDDEEDMCWALSRILEAEGCGPVKARSAQEALRLLAAAPFQLAFVDLKLPDMEGLDLVQLIRHQAPDLPCVLVSGYLYDDDDAVQAKTTSGLICGFIGKPFILNQVRDALRHARAV